MPYLATSQSFLDQSSLLLEAYPDTTRITTKYSFPSTRRSSSTNPPAESDNHKPQPQPPVASLTLKTFNPGAGICLKYRTDKAAEVGRLMLGLGRLAAGKDVSAEALGGAVALPVGDVEMGDAGAGAGTVTAPAEEGNGGAKGVGGKGKKKGGKGKR